MIAILLKEIADFSKFIRLYLIAYYRFDLSNQSLLLLHGNMKSPQFFINVLVARLRVTIDQRLSTVIRFCRNQDVVFLNKTQFMLYLMQLFLQ